MMVWEYFTHFHKSALCYTDVHVYRATSLYSFLDNYYFLILPLTDTNCRIFLILLHRPFSHLREI